VLKGSVLGVRSVFSIGGAINQSWELSELGWPHHVRAQYDAIAHGHGQVLLLEDSSRCWRGILAGWEQGTRQEQECGDHARQRITCETLGTTASEAKAGAMQ
jgi:hypothetical protein